MKMSSAHTLECATALCRLVHNGSSNVDGVLKGLPERKGGESKFESKQETTHIHTV